MPTIRYLGTDENILSLEVLKNMYQLVSSNLEHARKKRDRKTPVMDKKVNGGDSVLLKDHSTGVWDPMYTGDYWIMSFPGKTQVKVEALKVKVKVVHILDVKYVLPADRVI